LLLLGILAERPRRCQAEKAIFSNYFEQL
jgi:hypothetical protein